MQESHSPVPGITFDIAPIATEMRGETGYERGGHTARPLVREADLRVMLLVMKAGSVIEEHSAKETASVYTVSGHLRVRLPTGVVEVPSGRLLVLERGLLHSVEAVEESSFLLSRGSHEKP
jgi:quercetin dioxygenase-like cupin family protein